jgi:hypothetical protein
MLRATAGFLRGEAFPRLGKPLWPPAAAPRPGPLYGWRRKRPPVLAEEPGESQREQVTEADVEAVARLITAAYPRRRYPAIAIGASHGAVVHLCAALGIPWLPASVLVPARPRPRVADLPEDRPAPRPVTHFRITPHRLGDAYGTFLSRCLAAGGTILVVDAAPAAGSAEVVAEADLLDDMADFSRRRGGGMVRLVFDRSADLSPLVADLYVWWYRRRSLLARRLLATALIVSDPLWTLRIGAVPFWLEAIDEATAANLEHYLEMRPPFDYINLCLFRREPPTSRPAPVERWQGILARAKRRGEFAGVDAASYPADVSSFGRYQAAIKRIPARYPIPAPLPLDDFGDFLRYAGRYRLAVQRVNGGARWVR